MPDSNILPLVKDDFMISLTSSARSYLGKYVADHLDKDKSQNKTAIRFSIKRAGCSGWMYISELCKDTDALDDDFSFEVKSESDNNFKIYVAKDAKSALNGVVVDYVKQNLGQSKLTYHNPNETAKCGCGESFMMEDDDKLDNKKD